MNNFIKINIVHFKTKKKKKNSKKKVKKNRFQCCYFEWQYS